MISVQSSLTSSTTPRLYVHARQVHDASVNTTYDLADRNTTGKAQKEKREVVSELEDTPDLIALKGGPGRYQV